MRPDLRHNIQERFQGHEADVDPGIWDAIRSQISAPATDPVEDLFRERFQGHEVNVDPGVWNAISSQVGQAAAVGSAPAGGTFLNWAAAGLGTLVLSTGIYLATRNSGPVTGSSQVAETQFVEKTADVIPDQQQTAAAVPLAIQSEGDQVNVALDKTEPSSTLTAFAKSDTPEPVTAVPPVTATPSGPTLDANTVPSNNNGLPESVAAGAIDPAPRPGNVVVKDVMLGLKQQLHEEALAAEKVDPIGPPAVERTEASEVTIVPERSTTPAPLPEVVDIFMPNTFTPNGDGINDTYRIDRDGFQSMMIRIYSLQNNSLVFSTDANEEWDGGNCQKGYYLVAIEAITDDGRLVTKGKAVWLNNEY